ncbi:MULTISPECIES: iron-containing alcohol dehydrogenase [Caballeronia]|jgi:alcohol dehydrogenase class IV|uniref:4-hydroxybutyrate dehydrogenase n=1 Tax=Caballeronia zhejiangensis TaxID=871203 RepID=A0A656QWZ5_9BURK|nr:MULTISPECIES: iron-containing alcohol dehydrogenase [Caballeronia]EKS71080.1 4-hydroxybutyrate dehydrogenase [Burkholderia sp. SJ98]KDR34102.1 4-hydroxybutyrate dehydrogenase [Caballeronia zhejiangensis]MCG7403184.1 iron-containing alcohol dehydrogenase [Caballeronia zhejiangensis]MCI1044008.1 iron-containing alcohol dehydrogenase [Caballeronia zhejiangensis]MDR5769979.1 iron-containing alcohol dehydrogenase [Caballeronia sp. LZ028]
MSLINYVTQIQFDFGAVNLLKSECERLSIRRPLIVTDRGIRAAGILDTVLKVLERADGEMIYDATPPNPNEAAVREAVALYRQAECDGIIAVGGGSSIDLAKGVAVCATHEGPLQSFAVIEGGASRITAKTAPVIAVPTTAGTGSEVGRGAILILDDGRKVGVISPHVVPKVAICDPGLTVGLPPQLTAATGMDAIAHCLETFMSPMRNPPADGIALDGLRRAWAHIERATKEPTDQTARENMMMASMEGALAFQKGLGCVHSLSHSLGGIDPRLHHGTLNAIFLPAVVEFNRSAPSMRDEEKMERMASAMQLRQDTEISSALRDMTARLGLPTGLRALGVTREMFPRIVSGALKDHSHKTNPREASEADYLGLLEASY